MTVNGPRSATHQTAPEPITLAGEARLWLWHDVLPDAEATQLQAALRADLDWQQPRIKVFGRYHTVPRLTAWHGDTGLPSRYSGHDHVADGWPTSLIPIRETSSRLTGCRFNSVLANCYRDGQDSMGYHSDDEPELGAQPWIASYSLGVERDFVFRPRSGGRQCFSLPLPDNSLLLMSPQVQHDFQHALPRRRRVKVERINLTFRWIYAGDQPQKA